MMINRWIKRGFWFILLSVILYVSIKFDSYLTCEPTLPLNGWEDLLLVIATLFFLHKFLVSTFVNLNKDHRGGLFFILAVMYFIVRFGLINNSETDDLRKNGGIVVAAKIVDKLPSQKSSQRLAVNFISNNQIDRKSIKVKVEDFKKKERGDTVLLLYSPTCRSTSKAYDLYPSKSDIKKCLKGCEFEYSKKGLSQIKSNKQKAKD